MRSKGVTLRRWLGRVGCALNWHRMGSLVWVQCAIVRSSKRTNLLVRVLRELVRCVDIAAPHPSSTTAGSVCRFSDDAAERKRSTALNRRPVCPTQQHAVCARHSSTRRASTPRRVCKVTRRRRRTRALTATVSRSDVDSHREALGGTLVIHYTVTPTLCLSFTTS